MTPMTTRVTTGLRVFKDFQLKWHYETGEIADMTGLFNMSLVLHIPLFPCYHPKYLGQKIKYCVRMKFTLTLFHLCPVYK